MSKKAEYLTNYEYVQRVYELVPINTDKNKPETINQIVSLHYSKTLLAPSKLSQGETS